MEQDPTSAEPSHENLTESSTNAPAVSESAAQQQASATPAQTVNSPTNFKLSLPLTAINNANNASTPKPSTAPAKTIDSPKSVKKSPKSPSTAEKPQITAKTREIVNQLKPKSPQQFSFKLSLKKETSPRSPPSSTQNPASSGNVNSVSEDIHEDLFKRNEVLAIKKKLVEQDQRDAEKNVFFRPKINPVSKAIASNLGSTAQERLLGSKKSMSPKRSTEVPVTYSFKPEINEHSRKIEEAASSPRGALARINNLYKKEEQKQQEIKALQQVQLDKELQNCTFSPSTRAPYVEYNPQKFNERVMQWDYKRKNRLQKERQEVEKKEMEQCTFKPNTQLDANNPNASLMKQQAAEEPVGFEQFIFRQKHARKIKEQTSKVFATGEKWKNELTVPVEFSIGKHGNRGHVSALSKPASPRTESASTVHAMLLKYNLLQVDTDYDYGNGNGEYYEGNGQEGTDDGYGEEFYEQEGNNVHASEIDTANIPPQGLFSSPMTGNMMQGNTRSSENVSSGSPNSSTKQPKSPSTNSKEIVTQMPSPEWMRRRHEKNAEIQKSQELALKPWKG